MFFYSESSEVIIIPLSLLANTSSIYLTDACVGTSSQITFTVSSSGQTVETVYLNDDSNQFDFSPSSFILTGSITSQVVTVTFTPTKPWGLKTGNLTLSASGGSLLTLAMSGNAVAVPLALTSSNELTFNKTVVNSSSLQTFIVSAGGFSSVEETVTVSDDSNQFSFSPSSFPLTGSGASQTITATFSPTSTGVKLGNLTLSSSGGDINIVSLAGTCVEQYYYSSSLIMKADTTYGSLVPAVDDSNNIITFSKVNTGNGQIYADLYNTKYSTSLFFNGSGSLLNVGTGSAVNYAPLNLGSSDWTLEFWCNPLSSSLTSKTIYGNYGATTSTTNRYLFRFFGGKFGFYHRGYNAQWSTTSNIPFGVWSHLAVARQGSTIRIFFNGVLENTISNWSAIRPFDSDPLHAPTIGGYWQDASTYSPQGWYAGNLEDFRITKGVSRYTANFTPPGIL